MSAEPILPWWLVAPPAAGLMLLIAGHLLAMRRARRDIPASRLRIRSVNGALSLTLVPLLAAAFSLVPPADARAFLIIWTACIGLLGLVLLMSLLDAANSARLHREARAELRAEAARIREHLRQELDKLEDQPADQTGSNDESQRLRLASDQDGTAADAR